MSQIAELMGGRRLSNPAPFEAGILNQTGTGYNVQTLGVAEGLTLVAKSSAPFQKITTDAGGNTLTLPSEASSKGLSYRIVHIAGAGTLTVQSDDPATIVSLDILEAATLVCNGTTWIHMGVQTVAAS